MCLIKGYRGPLGTLGFSVGAATEYECVSKRYLANSVYRRNPILFTVPEASEEPIKAWWSWNHLLNKDGGIEWGVGLLQSVPLPFSGQEKLPSISKIQESTT